jgi:hypothetical protein
MTANPWLSVGEVMRILRLSNAEVLALVNAGTLRSRSTARDALPRTLISEESVELYLASKPSQPAHQTFIKVNGRIYEEV